MTSPSVPVRKMLVAWCRSGYGFSLRCWVSHAEGLGTAVQFGRQQILERAVAGVRPAEVLHLVADADRQLIEMALVVVVPEAGDELLDL